MFQKQYHSATTFSQLFLVVSGISFVLSLFKADTIRSFLSVIPAKVFPGFEVWRLLTFPFSSSSIESFILLTLCVGLFLPIVESHISTRKLIVASIGLFIAQSLLYVVTFQQQTTPVLAGADSMSFFAMGLYTFLQPHRPISIWKNIEIRGMFVVVLLSGISFLYSGIRSAQSTELFYYCAVNSAFGVLFAVLTTFTVQGNWRFFRFRRDVQIYSIRSSDDLFEHQEELVSSDGQQREVPISYITTSLHLTEEEMLDQILDKIYEHGQDSLSQEEKQFLEDYSQRLR
ncbi:MAG: DUF6576 domain-containing protein [Candidatus Kapaibacterium sp.]|nr:hypothetical protein [Bacteroidota bacterium]